MTHAQRLFDELNAIRFRNRLPRYRVLQILPAPTFSNLRSHLGRCDGTKRQILLCRGLTEKQLRLVLLHEMCHIGLENEDVIHGPRFIRRLRRLIRQGEELAEELDFYSHWPPGFWGVPLKHAAWTAIDSLATEHPRMQWRHVRPRLAARLDLNPNALERRLRWVRAGWLKMSRRRRLVSALRPSSIVPR